MTTATPPRLAEGLLRLLLPPHDRDAVSGDLLEEYRDSIHASRGPARVDAWYWIQVLGFLWHDNKLPAALLGSLLIARTALDWLVPTTDFHTRSTLTTWLVIGTQLFAGFAAAWRSRSPWIGPFAGAMTVFIAQLLHIAGALCLLALFHDQRTWAAIEASGGLDEVFALPMLFVLPAALLATVGSMFGYAVRSTATATER